MATGTITVFNTAKEWLMDGTFDLDTNTIKLAIADNTTAPTATTATPSLADFTQVGAAGSYTDGGVTLTCTWVESAGTVTLDETAGTGTTTWTQNASNDTDAYWGIIYASGALNGQTDPCIAFVELGGPVDMAAGSLTVDLTAGIFTLT